MISGPKMFRSLFLPLLVAPERRLLTGDADKKHEENGQDVHDHLHGLLAVHVGVVVEGNTVPQERQQRRYVVEHCERGGEDEKKSVS